MRPRRCRTSIFDGELQPPAPALAVESGFTFAADAVDFDEDTVLDAVADELPDSTIEGFAIEGGDGGVVRYLVSARSAQGGVLAVTVGRRRHRPRSRPPLTPAWPCCAPFR